MRHTLKSASDARRKPIQKDPLDRLPRAPSRLIALALRDIQKAERSKIYVIDMGDWHDFDFNTRKCSVCMAGAVMAQTIGLDPHVRETPWSLTSDWRVQMSLSRKLFALDFLRTGDTVEAFRMLGLRKTIGKKFARSIQSDTRDGKTTPEWKRSMRLLQRDLARAGL